MGEFKKSLKIISGKIEKFPELFVGNSYNSPVCKCFIAWTICDNSRVLICFLAFKEDATNLITANFALKKVLPDNCFKENNKRSSKANFQNF